MDTPPIPSTASGSHTSDCSGPVLPTPPLLNPIGNKSAQLDGSLGFQVVATPTDSDAVTLTASNLPAGSAFYSTNENGSFVWASATPTGVYSVSFYATDKDGNDSETISITVSSNAPVDTNCAVIFSEYIEGSSNNKAVEIYNPTESAIDLTTGSYVVQVYANGNATPTATINLAGSVDPKDVFVLANSTAGATLLALADMTSGSLSFNGDDALVLRSGGSSGTVLDSIGQVGTDPGTQWGSGLTSTLDHTLRRKAAVKAGDVTTSDAFDPATEWDGYAIDTFDGLGSHTNDCSGPVLPTPPILNAIGNKSVTVSNALLFTVVATPTDSDTVTLTASNLPAGSAFYSTNENGSFVWASAMPTGVYSVSFYAADKDGTDSETLDITVGEASLELLAPVIQAASLVQAEPVQRQLAGLGQCHRLHPGCRHERHLHRRRRRESHGQCRVRDGGQHGLGHVRNGICRRDHGPAGRDLPCGLRRHGNPRPDASSRHHGRRRHRL